MIDWCIFGVKVRHKVSKCKCCFHLWGWEKVKEKHQRPKHMSLCRSICDARWKWERLITTFLSFSDSSMYAHFLFEAFDTHNNGSVSFEVGLRLVQLLFLWWMFLKCSKELRPGGRGLAVMKLALLLLQDFAVSLSILLRGSITDKLHWAFNLYDLNKDGCITKEVTPPPIDWNCHFGFLSSFASVFQEMTDIMFSIYDMMGRCTYPSMKVNAPKEHVDSFFQVISISSCAARVPWCLLWTTVCVLVKVQTCFISNPSW